MNWLIFLFSAENISDLVCFVKRYFFEPPTGSLTLTRGFKLLLSSGDIVQPGGESPFREKMVRVKTDPPALPRPGQIAGATIHAEKYF
jgi:hypothetical protein